MDLATQFAEAQALVRDGNRAGAHVALAAILRQYPKFAAGWLWMSGVIDDPVRQRECLERVLALEPENASAKHGLAILDLDAIMASMSFALPITSTAVAAQRIGDYLVSQNFISKEQLEQAVREQTQSAKRGTHVLLGDIMVQHGWLSMQVLAKVLDQQKEARGLKGKPVSLPLGEYLLKQRLINPDQLQAVLTRQAELRQLGMEFLLGELLISSGMLSRQQLDEAIEDQRQQFYSMMGD